MKTEQEKELEEQYVFDKLVGNLRQIYQPIFGGAEPVEYESFWEWRTRMEANDKTI